MFGRHVLFNAALAGTAAAGTVLWDGRFNNMTSSAELSDWSWSNQIGPYQYYIHGTSNVTAYVNLDSSYKNPSDAASKQGAKITIDDTSIWNSDTYWRTELIPQTSAAINAGTVFYHFSLKRSDTNAPSTTHEHQVAFFESHFTEMKYGWVSGESGTNDASLRWDVGSQSKWNVTWEADVWHNVAYGIDFDAGTVTLHHSTGSAELVETAGPFDADTSSNGADWHLGVLRLTRDGYASDAAEDWFFSGVYVESGELTTSVTGPGETYGGGDAASSSGSSSSSAAATSAAAAETPSSSVVSAASSTPTPTTAATTPTPPTPTAISKPDTIAAPKDMNMQDFVDYFTYLMNGLFRAEGKGVHARLVR